ncbi:MAG: hypothetical protein QW166_00705 [Candidatus Bathyarchaeia archaeon]
MLDEDLACEYCLKEAIERRFLFYPNHDAARVRLLRGDNKENCTICGGSGAKYSVSIIMSSLNKNRLIQEREMIKEIEKNAKKKV